MADIVRESPVRDRVLRYILGGNAGAAYRNGYDLPTTTYAVSKVSEIAFSWVHRAASDLIEAGVLTSDLKLKDPLAAYQWWAAHRKASKFQSLHVASPVETVRDLATKFEVAATCYYAEQAYGGHLFPRRMDVYVVAHRAKEARQSVIEAGGLIGGTNFRIYPADDHLLKESAEATRRHFKQPGYPIAPLPQVIVDLLQERGSAVEAAELLIEKAYHAKRSLS